MTPQKLIQMKQEERAISMVTCYDAWSAKIIEQTSIDCVLVGDSAAMVMHGHSSTLAATVEMMSTHVAAVSRGLGAGSKKLLVGDMPFMSYRKGIRHGIEAAEALMRAGAHTVKLEGVWGHEDVISQIVGSGVPVQGHIGLTPQSIHGLGGYKVQGRGERERAELLKQARKLEELGCSSLFLECVPTSVAKEITLAIGIPTIGIGAGPYCDGQVLVLQDMLGFNGDFKAKFVKHYSHGIETMQNSLNAFDQEVKERSFPTEKESYSPSPSI